MRDKVVWIALLGLTIMAPAAARVGAQTASSRDLDIYFIDVEG